MAVHDDALPEEAVQTRVVGKILVLTLNRPAALNAIDTATARLLLAGVRRLDDDDELAVGVIAGAGRGFCSGMDLKAFLSDGFPADLGRFLARGARKPLIAAVEGFALAGGLEIALTCDLIVAASEAKFGVPEVTVGLFAAGGGLKRLPHRLPPAVAMEMALTGLPVRAERAYELGLVNRVCEPGKALDEALSLADRISRQAPLAVRISKQLIRESAVMTEDEFWAAQQPLVEQIAGSADAKEGPRSFAEKRPPNWTGA